jgi:hypothetical protein
VSVAIAGLLWAPALLYGLGGYPIGYTPTMSLLSVSGWLWVGIALAVTALAVLTRHTRYRWLTTTLAILTLYPRVHLHYIGLLGVAAPPSGTSRGRARQRFADLRPRAVHADRQIRAPRDAIDLGPPGP